MHDQTNILEGLKQKDERAFEVLFKTHYEALVKFTYKYLNNAEEAEEIVQETFYNLWKKSSEIKIQTSIKSYLYQAVRNSSLNAIKHKQVQKKYIDHVEKNDTSLSTENHMELDELTAKINEAINQLPPKCKQVFELSRYEEKKYQEIADELGISIKTVENHMGKALSLLRKSLKEYIPIYLIALLNLINNEI
jgi:RNA polymerase sigma-70 factor (ECF subfamily)